jgi:DtxR family transcriptional regulator, Mn-dependent transcriptional regulator
MAIEARAKPTNTRNRRDVDGPTEKQREYLEVIYYLAARREPIIAARLAEWMQVQPPTVTVTLQKMAEKGYITRDEKGAISLTERGHALAEEMVRVHRLVERFLVDVMHVPWHAIHEEAVRLEHALSPRMLARVEELVGGADTCPHGNPIPGKANGYIGHVRLDRALPNTRWQLCRIMEEAEEDHELMRFMQSNDLIPGNVFTVANSSSSIGVTLQQHDQRITIPADVATVLWGQIVE